MHSLKYMFLSLESLDFHIWVGILAANAMDFIALVNLELSMHMLTNDRLFQLIYL